MEGGNNHSHSLVRALSPGGRTLLTTTPTEHCSPEELHSCALWSILLCISERVGWRKTRTPSCFSTLVALVGYSQDAQAILQHNNRTGASFDRGIMLLLWPRRFCIRAAS